MTGGVTTFATDGLDPRSRAAVWQATTSQLFIPIETEVEGGPEFFGRIRANRVGEVGIASIEAGAQTVRRSRRLIQSNDDTALLFLCQTQGRGEVLQDSRRVELGVGDITYVESDRPYQFRFDDAFAQTVLQVPKSMFLRRCVWLEDVPATRIDGGSAIAVMLRANMDALVDVGGDLAANAQEQVSGNIIDMLALALRDYLDAPSQGLSLTRTMHIQRAKQYIMRNLKEPDLRPEQVAGACGLSPRYLRDLFTDEPMSASAWIRTQRLESARMDLERPSKRRQSLSHIAYRWGFSDYTHFSRAFKSAYGSSPRLWRKAVLGARP